MLEIQGHGSGGLQQVTVIATKTRGTETLTPQEPPEDFTLPDFDMRVTDLVTTVICC